MSIEWVWRSRRYGWRPPFGEAHRAMRKSPLMRRLWQYIGLGLWRSRGPWKPEFSAMRVLRKRGA